MDYNINFLDIALAIPLALGVYKGIKKGFVLELTSLLGLIIGIVGGIYFFDFGKAILERHFDIDEKYLPVLAFVCLFVSIVLIVSLTGKILDKFLKMVALGGLNRAAGALFGLLKMAVILSIVLMFVHRMQGLIPFISKEQTEKSILYKPIRLFVPALLPHIDAIEGWQDVLEDSKNLLNKPKPDTESKDIST